MLQIPPHDLLRHYCDLNEIPYHSSRDEVITYIIDHPTHTITYYTPYGWIFDLVHQFVRGDIDLETAMTSGDMGHAYPIASLINQGVNCIVYDLLVAKSLPRSDAIMIEIQ